MITAPYNFVPLNKKVVEAYWADQISHDKPFKAFVSGTLEIEMTAENPIYIRNGGKTIFITNKKGDKEEIPDPEFNNLNGSHFIPGSSIKGMLRSVVEILSFGKLEDKVNDVKLSVRDFSRGAKDAGIYDPSKISQEALAGWLKKEGDYFILKPCGRPGRISHKELDKLTKLQSISKHYQNKNNVSNDKEKSAKDKNRIFNLQDSTYFFGFESEDEGIGRKKFVLDQNGNYKGQIVLTGQASERKEPNKGKQYEFIFFEVESKEIIIDKDDPFIKNFLYAVYEHDKAQQSVDWRWRKEDFLNIGKSIPVFFRSAQNEISKIKKSDLIDMGLTLTYKVTYRNSIKESISNFQDQIKRDLSEAIFGYTVSEKETKEKSLKGRVWVSHAFAEGNPKSLGMKLEVLAGPKPTYYPNYIKQNESNGKIIGKYSTFMDKEPEIRGYKRYPVRFADEIDTNPPPKNERTGEVNEKVATRFKPLDKGTKFKFSITYHNLKKAELGALISAITFHLNDGYSHTIGMGKSLGYGRVNLQITNKTHEDLKSFAKEFEAFMNWALGNSTASWHQSEQIRELITLCKPFPNLKNKLKYMAKPLDFAAAKGKGKDDPQYALLKYSEIVGVSQELKTLLANDELTNYIKNFNSDMSQLIGIKESDPGKEWIQFYLNKVKIELNNLIEIKKYALIQEVLQMQKANKKKKTEMIIERVRAIEEDSRIKLIQAGLDLSGVKNNSRAFDDVTKKVTQFIKKLKADSLISANDINTFLAKMKEIFPSIPKKELSKWEVRPLEKNVYFQKISKWIGEEEARKLFEELN